ncbi:hypothetical protein EDB83DRAFT_2449192, partial [Lactarius deliciosus]
SRHLGRRRFSSRLRSHLFQLLSALLWRTGLSRTLTNFGQSSGLRPGLSTQSAFPLVLQPRLVAHWTPLYL